MTKVTVILTTYNAAKALQRTLDSVAAQDGLGSQFEIEMIAIDDCSTDATCAILAQNGIEFLSTGSNTGGPNRGRNLGLDRATGDWISILDHDDVWKSDRLRSLLDVADKTPAPVLTSGYTVHDVATGREVDVARETTAEFTVFGENETFRARLRKDKGGQIIYLGGLLFRHELRTVQFEEVKGQSDFDWVVRLFESRASAEVSKPLFIRYLHDSNLSMDEQYRLADHELSLRSLQKYADRFPDDVDVGSKRIHGSLARYYYSIGEFQQARAYFRQAPKDAKTLMYLLTSYVGHGFVRRFFRVFR